jgi:hypothetical protein
MCARMPWDVSWSCVWASVVARAAVAPSQGDQVAPQSLSGWAAGMRCQHTVPVRCGSTWRAMHACHVVFVGATWHVLGQLQLHMLVCEVVELCGAQPSCCGWVLGQHHSSVCTQFCAQAMPCILLCTIMHVP